MSSRRPSRVPRGRIAALACAAVVASTGGPARADGAPTFRATTTVETTVLPRPAAEGAWTLSEKGRVATLTVTVLNPSPAVTRLDAGWVSPFARARGTCFGQYRFYYKNHRLLTPTPHVLDQVRYREQGGRWSRWFTELDHDYYDTDPNMVVGGGQTDDCVFLFRRAPRRPLQLEIRHAVEYGGTHRIEESLVVRVP